MQSMVKPDTVRHLRGHRLGDVHKRHNVLHLRRVVFSTTCSSSVELVRESKSTFFSGSATLDQVELYHPTLTRLLDCSPDRSSNAMERFTTCAGITAACAAEEGESSSNSRLTAS